MGDNTRAPKRPRVQVTCPCGILFEALASKIASGGGKYCSRACFNQARRSRRSEYVSVTCPCGSQFDVLAARVTVGRGKFCSKACRHRYGTRRSGLKYNIKANKGWFQPVPESERRTPEEKAAYDREWKHQNPDKVRAQDKRRYDKRTPDEHYRQMLWSHHRMTPEDWMAMFDAQGGRCYLCGDPLKIETGSLKRGKQVHIDHDHRCCRSAYSCSHCRRGLACMRCNHLIGHAKDDPDRLRRIADNLEKVTYLLHLED